MGQHTASTLSFARSTPVNTWHTRSRITDVGMHHGSVRRLYCTQDKPDQVGIRTYGALSRVAMCGKLRTHEFGTCRHQYSWVPATTLTCRSHLAIHLHRTLTLDACANGEKEAHARTNSCEQSSTCDPTLPDSR